ncbi:MAG: glucosyltransferase domain-containing protein [Clostridium sp.]|nr:glucosyltransferase domain-containing protein [Clostridium sp.]
MKWLKLDKKYMFTYFILSLLSFLYIFPMILVNADYKDDLGTSITGVIGLKGDGRPLGEYAVSFLCGGSPFTNVAPLSIILAVLFLSYALVLYAKINLPFVSNHYILISLLLLILTNPLAVECLSYRTVSVVMIAALALPFIMYAVPDTVPDLYLFIYSSFLCMAIMSLYQAPIGLCFVLFAVNVFFAIVGEKKLNIRREIIRFAGIGLSAVFYQLVVARHYVERNDWRYEASQLIDIKLSSIKIIIEHIIASCRYLITFLSATPIWYWIALIATIVFSIAVMLFLYCRESDAKGWKKAAGIAFFILSPILVFLATFLPVMVLRTLMLKTRIFLAMGGVLFYTGIFLLYYYRKKQKAFVALFMIVCIAYSYIYMYSYANAVGTKQEYAKYLVYNIVHDVETINADGEFSTLSFIGEMPRTNRIQLMYDKYPIYEEIIPKYFTNDSWIGGAWVLQYMQGDLKIEAEEETDNEIVETTEPVMKNSVYSCYVNGDKIIVAFH